MDQININQNRIINIFWNSPIKKIILSSILFISYMFCSIKESENFKSDYSLYAPISSIIMFLIFFGIYCLIFAKNALKTKNKKRYIFPFIFVSFYFSIHFFWFLLGGFFTFILCFYTFPIAIILLIFIEIIIISEELSEKNIEKIRHSERSEESH